MHFCTAALTNNQMILRNCIICQCTRVIYTKGENVCKNKCMLVNFADANKRIEQNCSLDSVTFFFFF